MASFKEIVTKAVVGKGKKYFKNSYSVEAKEATNVLGCWVINHKFKGYKTGNKIGVDGTYDVNIWYSYDNDSKTAVINKTISYNDLFDVKKKEDVDTDTEIIVKTLKQPTCSSVNIENGVINFDIEKELGIELVGEAKIKIGVEDDEEEWDEIVDEDELNKIDSSINENYIDESK